jgi:hypothetical protein
MEWNTPATSINTRTRENPLADIGIPMRKIPPGLRTVRLARPAARRPLSPSSSIHSA